MSKFPYQRLIHEAGFDFEADDYYERDRVTAKSRGWFGFRRVHIRRRFKLKVPSLRRLILRKKFRVVSAVRLSCAKVLKRLKESQAHFGDLFAGNYLFLQINPASAKCIQKSYQAAANEFNLHGFASTYSLPRLAK
ncbi:Plexin-D1 like [Melia azedarach]|uniref:Plexin-D1 like n=1 Tax=Melia azedarach TaxID=155640 RepID=A0ACC1Z391_MELAZ|nr:Plexin-D1 like [Melia azedarach]